MHSKLDDLVLRQKSAEQGLKKAKEIEAALAWFKGQLVTKPILRKLCHFEQALTRLPLAKSSQEVLYRVGFKDGLKLAGGNTVKKHVVQIPMRGLFLQESLAILRCYGKVILTSLNQRFANGNVVDDAVAAFSLEHDVPKILSPLSLSAALQKIKDCLASFQKSWEQLQHLKEDHVKVCLEQGVLKDLQRSDLKPIEVWADMLANLTTRPAF